MDEKEWLEYFEAVEGRKPSFEEYQSAKRNQEFHSLPRNSVLKQTINILEEAVEGNPIR